MRRILFWISWLLVGTAGIVVAVLLFVQHAVTPFIYQPSSGVPTSTAAMVLGASVYKNGTLSPVLRDRADRGAELYKTGKVKKILVTGDNGELSHNEVNPVGNYLLTLGIPKEDIFLDHAGFDTYSSMYRARDVFSLRTITIVSQPFHLARAVYIARSLGIEAYGVPAGEGDSFTYNTWREVPATIKALIDIVFSRSPKYLGPQFPIEGDGTPTWADQELVH